MKFGILITILFWTSTLLAKETLCPGVIVHGQTDLELTDSEKRLVCGDNKLEAYSVIPPYQAAFFMTGFLQSRGFLLPKFETIDGVLHVHLGEIATLNKVDVTSEIEKERKVIKEEITRRFQDKKLTPKLINSMEEDAVSLMRQHGYPCSEVKSQVDANTNNIHLDLLKTKPHLFGDFKKEEIKGLHENALERFYPFDEDDQFNHRLLDLTEKRMIRSEVVQVSYFMEECSQDGEDFSMSQHFVPGPPRTIRYGVGASTELGPMVRLRWSNNRMGSMASTLSAQVQGSLRSQSLMVTADTFFWKHKPRRSLLSHLEILRESQVTYEQLLFKISPVSMKWTQDYGGHHWKWVLGPSFEYGTYHSDEESSTKTFKTGVAEGSLEWMDHDYEFYDMHPQEGDKLKFNFGFRHPSFGFSDQSLRLESSYVKLSNLMYAGRGELIGGFRVSAGTLWINENVSPESLPPNVKFYGGGSDDIRGFLLNTLPRNDGLGAITKLGLKLELRKTYFFHESLEGFTFVDSSYFGEKSFSILPQLYYSPGAGLRWFSPIGIVQGYAAKALTTSPSEDEGYFFYAGLGGSF